MAFASRGNALLCRCIRALCFLHAAHLYRSAIYKPDARKADERLDGSTAQKYLAIANHLACDKFKANGSDTTKRFLDCLDTNPTSEHAKWLRGLKTNIEREHAYCSCGYRTRRECFSIHVYHNFNHYDTSGTKTSTTTFSTTSRCVGLIEGSILGPDSVLQLGF